jgi:AcrR family transcriptional regulator
MDNLTVVRVRPRDRIVEKARDLFHKYGIRGVGVDTITEAAGTNKMTLYRHFDSKDDLIIEYLRSVACDMNATWDQIEAKYPDDKIAQLRAWVHGAAECVMTDDRGCDIANAAIELTESCHPARGVIREIKTKMRDRLIKLCREAGIEQAERLTDTLALLIEGARVNRQSIGPDGPSARLVEIAEDVIESFRQGSQKR